MPLPNLSRNLFLAYIKYFYGIRECVGLLACLVDLSLILLDLCIQFLYLRRMGLYLGLQVRSILSLDSPADCKKNQAEQNKQNKICFF